MNKEGIEQQYKKAVSLLALAVAQRERAEECLRHAQKTEGELRVLTDVCGDALNKAMQEE